MTYEVCNKEINSQCAELLVRPLYIVQCTMYIVHRTKLVSMCGTEFSP